MAWGMLLRPLSLRVRLVWMGAWGARYGSRGLRGSRGFVVVSRAHAAEPQIDTAPRPLTALQWALSSYIPTG